MMNVTDEWAASAQDDQQAITETRLFFRDEREDDCCFLSL